MRGRLPVRVGARTILAASKLDDSEAWSKMGNRQLNLRCFGPGGRAGGVRSAGCSRRYGGGLEGCQVVGNGGDHWQCDGRGAWVFLCCWAGYEKAASQTVSQSTGGS